MHLLSFRTYTRSTVRNLRGSLVSPLLPASSSGAHLFRSFSKMASVHGKHAPFKEVEASRPPFEGQTKYKVTQIVDPKWQVPKGINEGHPDQGHFEVQNKKTKEIKPEDLDGPTNYKLLINGVVPRPIAFVSSQDKNGVRNLAPYSYFSVVGHNPPIISVSVNAKAANSPKDTGANIMETKRFTVNIISEPFVSAANFTSVDAPPEVSEWDLSGLTPVPNTTWGGDAGGPPRVGESAYSLECELHQVVEIKNDDGISTAFLVLGRIRRYHISEHVLNEDFTIDPARYLPVSRGGGITYFRTLQGYEVPRPKWSEEKEKPEVQATIGSSQKSKQ